MIEVQKVLTCVSVDGMDPCVKAMGERITTPFKGGGLVTELTHIACLSSMALIRE